MKRKKKRAKVEKNTKVPKHVTAVTFLTDADWLYITTKYDEEAESIMGLWTLINTLAISEKNGGIFINPEIIPKGIHCSSMARIKRVADILKDVCEKNGTEPWYYFNDEGHLIIRTHQKWHDFQRNWGGDRRSEPDENEENAANKNDKVAKKNDREQPRLTPAVGCVSNSENRGGSKYVQNQNEQLENVNATELLANSARSGDQDGFKMVQDGVKVITTQDEMGEEVTFIIEDKKPVQDFQDAIKMDQDDFKMIASCPLSYSSSYSSNSNNPESLANGSAGDSPSGNNLSHRRKRRAKSKNEVEEKDLLYICQAYIKVPGFEISADGKMSLYKNIREPLMNAVREIGLEELTAVVKEYTRRVQTANMNEKQLRFIPSFRSWLLDGTYKINMDELFPPSKKSNSVDYKRGS